MLSFITGLFLLIISITAEVNSRTIKAPYSVKCPSNDIIRTANQYLNEKEIEYINGRQKLTFEAHKEFIQRLKIGDDFDTNKFFMLISKPVTISIAISGGGYRSMLTSAGAIQAFDIRTPNSTNQGQLGGLLQATSYISTVSGGSWLLSSLLLNDFKPVNELKEDKHVWNFNKPLLEGIPQIDFDGEKEKFSNKNSGATFAKRDLNNIIDGIDNVKDSFILNDLFHEFDGIFETGLSALVDGGTLNNVSNFTSESILSSQGDTSNKEQEGTEVSLKLKETISSQYNNNNISNLSSATLNTNNQKLSEILLDTTKTFLNKEKEDLKFIKNTTAVEDVFKFYQDLNFQVRPKKLSGFRITFTDFWGRALAKILYQASGTQKNNMANDTINSHSIIPFSSIADRQVFKNFEIPFPIILSNLRWPKVKATSIDSQILEINPYEFGSWDYYLNAFMNTKYLGSALFDGKPIFQDYESQNNLCMAGFDDISYIAATSSSLFNNVLIYVWQLVSSTKKKTSEAMKIILYTFGLSLESDDPSNNHPDYAVFSPNPFYGYVGSNADNKIIESPNLFLVDGGEDKQNIPFFPLLQKARTVDIIFAIDSTSDTNNYPNGTSLWATFNRYSQNQRLVNSSSISISSSHSNNSGSQSFSVFPKIPSTEEIMDFKMYEKPMFLGCHLQSSYQLRNENKFQTKNDKDYLHGKQSNWLPPVIVYYPNSYHSYHSNTSTFKLTYNEAELNGMIVNGANIVTYSNSTTVDYYDKCVGCITLKREFDRIELGMNSRIKSQDFQVPEICEKCFTEFCYS